MQTGWIRMRGRVTRVFYPDPSCLTLRQHFHHFWATLKHFVN